MNSRTVCFHDTCHAGRISSFQWRHLARSSRVEASVSRPSHICVIHTHRFSAPASLPAAAAAAAALLFSHCCAQLARSLLVVKAERPPAPPRRSTAHLIVLLNLTFPHLNGGCEFRVCLAPLSLGDDQAFCCPVLCWHPVNLREEGPFCWDCFGKGSCPRHGFQRVCRGFCRKDCARFHCEGV